MFDTYKHHYPETIFNFSVLVSISIRSWSIYVVSVWCFFVFMLIIINDWISLKQTHLLLVHFLGCLIIFGRCRGWREQKILKLQKFSLKVLLTFCQVFPNVKVADQARSSALLKSFMILLRYFLRYLLKYF